MDPKCDEIFRALGIPLPLVNKSETPVLSPETDWNGPETFTCTGKSVDEDIEQKLESRESLEPQRDLVKERQQQVREHVLETFGSVAKAEHWLHRPNQVFQGRTPLQVLEVDPCAIEAELIRIDHGVYI